MTGEILCVGTELLLGDIVNTNGAFLARELAALGLGVYHQTVVGDNAQRLEEAISLALSRSDLLIMTGGLGPTYDDITKETAAAALGKELCWNLFCPHRPDHERKQPQTGNGTSGLGRVPERKWHRPWDRNGGRWENPPPPARPSF